MIPYIFLGSAQPASIYRNVCLYGLHKSWRGFVDNTEARVAPGSTVQMCSSWWTVYLCSSATGPSKVCVLDMCTHCLLPRCGDFFLSFDYDTFE
jgi:hypothetical protein